MLRLYNTLTRKIEPFTPRHIGRVDMYTCGPTVYSTAHLGNLRSYIFADTLRRVLEYHRLHVRQVMNITDVGHLTSNADTGEDKLQQAAAATRRTAWQVAAQYAEEFETDLSQLHILKPDTIIKATDVIPDIIALIQTLEKKGFTYLTSDGVYFDTAKFPAYGRLGGQASAGKRAGVRIPLGEKKHATDFALWKLSPPSGQRDMEWPSPWGQGFPGWHIECSAISMKALGPQFDIHTGGIDHIAVHHENEIAQSEAATGKHPFVKYWMHNEFLVMPGKRMGKSEGNAVTIADVVNRGLHPLAFRNLCLQTHYRSPLMFSWEALMAAAAGLRNLWFAIDRLAGEETHVDTEHYESFLEAVDDDLNIPAAMSIIQKTIRAPLPDGVKLATIRSFDAVVGLGLYRQAPRPRLVTLSADEVAKMPDADIADWFAAYVSHRAKKEYEQSDKLRRQLEQRGLIVVDEPNGSSLANIVDEQTS